MKIKLEDVRIDISSVTGDRGLPTNFISIRMTHEPSGKSVSQKKIDLDRKSQVQHDMLDALDRLVDTVVKSPSDY